MTTTPFINAPPKLEVQTLKHPCFLNGFDDWTLWRDTYEGGEHFVHRYLTRYSERETVADFEFRRSLTPVPNYAKAVINEIRNAIFQRMQDIVRSNGSDTYMQAVKGEGKGVDNKGNSMAAFMGQYVIPELLIMGKYGIYVDMVSEIGPTLVEGKASPYIYGYRAENILNWVKADPENPSEFQALLLQDTDLDYCPVSGLPRGEVTRYRFVYLGEDGFVYVQFYNKEGVPIARDGSESYNPIKLALRRIPFHLFDIGDSLLKDVSRYQVSLLNIESSNINYAIRSNFPMYTEQRDLRPGGSHLKKTATESGTATAGGQQAGDDAIRVGATYGRAYPLNADRPGYIAPPSEPLETSEKLCSRIEETIRKLVNLSLVSKASSASGASKAADREGLENGLAFIGLVLENGERRVASFWANYENRNPSQRKVAVVKYPDRYSLKDDADRIEEADKLSKLIFAVPSNKAKREMAKLIVDTLMASKVNSVTLAAIRDEIDNAEYITSDPEIVIKAKEAGIVGDRLASISMGYPEGEYLVAREDHADRLGRIAESQGGLETARGISDNQVSPSEENANEKELSRFTDDKETTEEPTRGEGK